jgi:hypothetical protein
MGETKTEAKKELPKEEEPLPEKPLPIRASHFGKFSKLGAKYYKWHHEHVNKALGFFIIACIIALVGILFIIPRDAGFTFILGLGFITSGIPTAMIVIILDAKASGNARILMVEQFSRSDRVLYKTYFDEFG